MKIAVITDSSAGVSREEALHHDILVARMPLTIDGKEYIEEEGISRERLIQAMKSGASVSTSQPPIGKLMEMFERVLMEYDHIIFLPISSKLSGTYQTACGLAQDYEGKVTVIDSKFVSCPLFLQALEVKEMITSGMKPNEIKHLIEDEAEMYVSLIPEDITYLKRGGRITPAAAAIANLLKIVPVLKVAQGEIDLAEKVRTYKKAVRVGFELTVTDQEKEDYEWIVLNGDCDEKVYQAVVKDLEKHVGADVVKRPLYPIVLAHTGPGSIAIARRKRLIKK